MSKRIKLVPYACPAQIQTTNWDLCVLCQNIGGTLIDPTPAGYDSLANNLYSFDELNNIPLNINLSRLNDGNGIKETLMVRKAKWHRACYVNCNATKVERVRKKHSKESKSKIPTSPVKERLRSDTSNSSFATESKSAPTCFFCDESSGPLHKVETLELDTRLRKIVTDLGDRKLLAKLSVGDLIAIGTVYHTNCLISLYNKHRSQQRGLSAEQYNKCNAYSLALAEVVSYIEEYRQLGDSQDYIFKLTDLKQLYTDHVKKLAGDTTKFVHSTRLAQKIQEHIPTIQIHNSKSGTLLTFKKDAGDAMLTACEPNPDEEAVMLKRVSTMIRKEIFERNYNFKGSLCDEEYKDLPPSLSTLVGMILGESSTSQHDGTLKSNAVFSITQLLVFNTVKQRTDSLFVRHNLNRETALPLYIGLLIHNKTRKRDLIDNFFEKGLSVSYDRVLQLSTNEANKVIDQYEHEGVVCPKALRDNLFTTGNLDNIDHNPSSVSSIDSFKGAGISIIQHIKHDNFGSERSLHEIPDDLSNAGLKAIKSLPTSYTNVPPVLPIKDTIPPITYRQTSQTQVCVQNDEEKMQNHWFQKIKSAVGSQNNAQLTNVSWSAFFASSQICVPKPPAIVSLLPLFRDSAHTPAMVKHGMDIIKQITHQTNPGQIPVLTVDQPLYAIAKRIQWKWPEQYGEQKYVVLMGGLHIEIAMLKVIGDWLDGSGWTYVLSAANVSTEGRVDSLQKGSHISRGQWAHQVTAAALYILLHKAYDEYKINNPDNEQTTFDDWCKQSVLEQDQFNYWYTVWRLELMFLQFLRSEREHAFQAYKEALLDIIPWMFALDHYLYARWMSVHMRDLLALEFDCPSVHQQFSEKGNFVTQKTNKKFSGMAHDHVHEQLNAIVKGDGGAIGLTENESALKRWMVAGPETARILTEYEDSHSIHNNTTDLHHEQIPSVQKRFVSQVNSVVDVIVELGNPFKETNKELCTLDTKQIMSKNVVTAVRRAEELGKTQYTQFVEDNINNNTKDFNAPIRKNNLPLMKSGGGTRQLKTTSKIPNLNNDVNLFSRMYIACQSRECDMDSFFTHENHPWPPALASNGIMHCTNKSDLIGCLESIVPPSESVPKVEAKILDGSAVVHILDPKKSTQSVKTFEDYAKHVFIPYVQKMLLDVVRLDVVWDVYRKESLKNQARQKRGNGCRIKVDNHTIIPSNWKAFLSCDENKDSLFKLLACALQELQLPAQKLVIATQGENAISYPISDMSGLVCSQEEADTRLLFHAFHAYKQGHRKLMVCATDTDVVVIAIAVASVLKNCEIWVAFGYGSKVRYIPCHQIAINLGSDASWGLLFLHAVSGCDTVSSFHGIGKKTVWNTWCSMPHLKPVFAQLSRSPSHLTTRDIEEIERFVIIMYQRTSTASHVNEARKKLFTQRYKMENIPPTLDALEHHVKRAVYQAGHIWGQSLIGNPEIPSPASWGWEKVTNESLWTPRWTTLPEASKACEELIKCMCKKSCSKRCSCVKASLKCTQLCYCSGQCVRE